MATNTRACEVCAGTGSLCDVQSTQFVVQSPAPRPTSECVQPKHLRYTCPNCQGKGTITYTIVGST